MYLKPITRPDPTKVYTLDQFKADHVIAGTDEDARLTDILKRGLAYCEAEACKALTTQTWEMVFPCFKGWIDFPMPPLQSVTSVKYFDDENEEQTLAPSAYYTVTPYDSPGWIEPVNSWPSTYSRPNAVTIRFVAGYADDQIPFQAEQAMSLYCGYFNKHREADNLNVDTAMGISRLLGQISFKGYA